MEVLLKAGADPNATDTFDYTPLHKQKDKKAVKTLLKAGADPNAMDENGETPLNFLIKEAKPNILNGENPEDICKKIKALIKAGADPNAKGYFRYTSLLLYANTNIEHIKILLKVGANPNVRNWNGTTRLHWENNKQTIIELLKAGADPNSQNRDGHTPLYLHINKEIISILLEAGSNPNIGKPPLFYDKTCNFENIMILHSYIDLHHDLFQCIFSFTYI